MNNKSFIDEILEDFKEKRIKPFFDLEHYETDFEISDFHKSLRIGYINKQTMNDPNSAFYIDFGKRGFELWCRSYSTQLLSKGTLIKDTYEQYHSVQEIYERITTIINNLDSFLNDMKTFEKIDFLLKEYNKPRYRRLKNVEETLSLFWEIHTLFVGLETDKKLIVEGEYPLSYMKTLLNNDGPEFVYIVNCYYIWNIKIKYTLGVCVRGRPLAKHL